MACGRSMTHSAHDEGPVSVLLVRCGGQGAAGGGAWRGEDLCYQVHCYRSNNGLGCPGYLAYGNSKCEIRGSIRHKNNSKIVA